MNIKLTVQFTLLTFAIMLASWGTMIVLGGFGIVESTHPWVFILQLIGSLSPAIASYIAMKKNKKNHGLQGMAQTNFQCKNPRCLLYSSSFTCCGISYT